MKAVQFYEYGSPSVLKVEDVQVHPLKDGQVRIKVSAAGVNFADTLQRRNQYPSAASLPAILGFEVSGTIQEVAGGVKGYKVGDRVVAMPQGGGYCELATADQNGIFTVPDGVSLEQAVSLPGQALTAYFVYKDAPLNQGDVLLVHAAAGGVGSVAAQIAKLVGVKTVIGTTSTASKMEKLKSYGYDHAINITDADWHKQVLELTSGKGADVILDSVGGPVFDESMKALAPEGRLVVFGFAGGKPTNLDPRVLTMKNQRVLGFSLWKYMARKNDLDQAMAFLFKGLIDKKLKVDFQLYPLEKAADVHSMMENRASTGKLLLQP
jgi:NADPH2:quinone reductase